MSVQCIGNVDLWRAAEVHGEWNGKTRLRIDSESWKVREFLSQQLSVIDIADRSLSVDTSAVRCEWQLVLVGHYPHRDIVISPICASWYFNRTGWHSWMANKSSFPARWNAFLWQIIVWKCSMLACSLGWFNWLSWIWAIIYSNAFYHSSCFVLMFD